MGTVLGLLLFATSFLGRDYSTDDLLFEGVLDEHDPRLVSLCVLTDDFSDGEYVRLMSALGKARDGFDAFDLDFYIIAHENRDEVSLKDFSYLLKIRKEFETGYGVLCDIVVLVTQDDLDLKDRDGDAKVLGIANPYPLFNGIIVGSVIKLAFWQLTLALEHELGHIFGAVHVDDDGSLMNETLKNSKQNRWDPTNTKIIMRNRDKFQ